MTDEKELSVVQRFQEALREIVLDSVATPESMAAAWRYINACPKKERNEIIVYLANVGLERSICGVRHTSRRRAVRMNVSAVAAGTRRIARRVKTLFLDRFLWADRRLGDWKGVELAKEAQDLEISAEGKLLIASYFRVLADRCKNRKVRSVMSSRRALQLWHEISGSDEDPEPD